MTQVSPRRLHSVHTLVSGMSGLRPDQQRGDHLEQLAPVDRAAAQLEVDRDVRGDRRRGGQRVDVLRAGVDDRGGTRSTSAKLRSAWMPPAVAQAPMVTRNRRLLADLRGSAPRRAAVVIDPSTRDTSYGPGRTRAGRLEEVGDPHLARPAPAARPRSRAGSAGSRRRRRTSTRRGSAWSRHHSSRTASSGSASGVADDRAVAADQQRAELAVPAQADAALHVPFQRHPDVGRPGCPCPSAPCAQNRIIGSGPHRKAVVRAGSSGQPARAAR